MGGYAAAASEDHHTLECQGRKVWATCMGIVAVITWQTYAA
jgi:hypothetical protein